MATITDSLITVLKTFGGAEYKRAFDQAAEASRKLAREEKKRQLETPVSAQAAGFAALATKVGAASIALFGFQQALSIVGQTVSATITPFIQAEQTFVRVALQMRNLGNVFPTAELMQFAAAMQQATGFSDEMIAELGLLAANLGLTQEQIKKAIGVSLNVAAGRPGVNPQDVLTRLVRASSTGRTTGLIALGIDPTKIKGDIRDIDTLLAELQSHFAGQAQVSRNTLGGSLNLLRERFDNLLEAVGRLAEPVISRAINLVSDVLEGWVLLFQRIGEFLERIGILAPLDVHVQRLGAGGGAAFKGDPEQTEYQGQIAANTKKTADSIGNFGRFLVGGGAAAQGALNIRGLNAALRAGR